MKSKYLTKLLIAVSMGATAVFAGPLFSGNDRIAYSSDGNIHDEDDIGATAGSMALLAASGEKSRLVYYGFADHVWDAESNSDVKWHNNKNGHTRMKEIVASSRKEYGFGKAFDGIFFDVYTEARKSGSSNFDNAAIDKLVAEINASSSSSKLWLIGAGPMEVIYQALDKADASKIQHVRFISHSDWNNNHASKEHNGHTWAQLKQKIINNKGIVHCGSANAGAGSPDPQVNKPKDQNGGLGTGKDYTMFRDSSDSRIRLIWDAMILANKKDISDAGMIYYLLNDDENATTTKVYNYLVKAPWDNGGGDGGGGGSTLSIPGTLQAEDYSSQSGIKTDNTSDTGGGKYVGWINSGDWFEFDVDVESAGSYKVEFRVAALSSNIKFDLKKGSTVVTSGDFSATGGWQTWKTESKTVTLSAGTQTLRVQATGGGWNINWLKFTKEESGGGGTGTAVFLDHNASSKRLRYRSSYNDFVLGTGTGTFYQWKKIDVDSTWFYLEHVGTGMRLGSTDGQTVIHSNGSPTGNEYQWKLVSVSGWNRLQHRSSGNWLHITETGANFRLGPTTWTGNRTKWQLNQP